ncbi:MAG TPA: hypothetical protein VIM56_02115 [Rhizomicrobium sp.]
MRLRALFGAAIPALSIFALAHVASAAEPQRLQESATVKDLPNACASDDPAIQKNECETTFFHMYQADLMTAAGYPGDSPNTLCIPFANDKDEYLRAVKSVQTKILAWLHEHPETLSKSVFDGTWDATLAVYKCKRGEAARW